MATVTRGQTFGATEQVTNVKLHTLVDSASITDIRNTDIAAGAGIDESKIAFDGSTVDTLADAQTISGDKTFTGTLDFSGATITTLLELIYPVGSLYFNGAVATNPATLLGFGTWVAACEGRQPVGFKATDTDYDTVLEQSGAKTVTLTAAQSGLVGHGHNFRYNTGAAGGTTYMGSEDGVQSAYDAEASGSVVAASAANAAESHSIMNPVETYYIWRRTV